MDTFTYHNIFDTKGIEYLIIIGFFAILIPFWLILNRKTSVTDKLRGLPGIITAAALRVPQGLFYSRNHTWAHLSRKGIAEVGLDDLLVHLTGEVKIVNSKQENEKISKGEVIAEIQKDGKILNVFSPLSGEIIAINKKLAEDPGIIVGDPYGEGWIFRIKPSDWVAETGSCFFAGSAVTWMGNELTRFRDFLMETTSKMANGSSVPVLQDGGELKDHMLAELPGEVWKEFQEDFMGLEPKCSRGGVCD
ncbi:MAG TPA: hypothetical protein VMT63_12460 [Bacteroidales bacterium]|nr:hypothetical protein [Bacteroidales bacterium]